MHVKLIVIYTRPRFEREAQITFSLPTEVDHLLASSVVAEVVIVIV